jgi:hypothetical protein
MSYGSKLQDCLHDSSGWSAGVKLEDHCMILLIAGPNQHNGAKGVGRLRVGWNNDDEMMIVW